MGKMKKSFVFSIIFLIFSSFSSQVVLAWSNGGYSSNPSNPDYGTHDWIAQHALDWLPIIVKQYILDYLSTYLYGTELPDNGQAPDGIGDSTNHHVYFHSNGTLQDDVAASRASAEYLKALSFLKQGNLVNAAKYAGILTHYISDVAVFGHVMGSDTDWGAETHHSDYEDYVNARTSSYNAEYNSYLVFDGTLDNLQAYQASINLAYDTTFDLDSDLTCVWMDQNYNWSNALFKNRAGESLNLAVNFVTDVLYTLYNQAQTSQPTTYHILINEVEQDPLGTDTGNEWVELYNPTANIIDINGWTVSTTAGITVTITIPSGTSIQASGYYVITYGSQWIDNKGESLILRDATSNEVDRTPSFNDTDNNGFSWQRYPNGHDTDSSSDWSFRVSTKGASNGGEKQQTTISCTLSKSIIEKGETITISGIINVPISATVTIQVSRNNGISWENLSNVTSSSNGYYSYTWKPSEKGTYKNRSVWYGYSTYLGATSSVVTLTVNEPMKIPTEIMFEISDNTITVGSSVTVNGAINTSIIAHVTIQISTDGGTTWNNLTILTTNSDGSFSYYWTPSTIGNYRLRAMWNGNQQYIGATSSAISVTVTKVSSRISCTPSSSSTIIGSSIIILGSISPACAGVPIIISYTTNASWNILATIMSASNGSYSHTWIPTSVETYQLKASWAGDALHEGAESNIASVSVNKISTYLSCSVSPSDITEGSTIEVTGSITPEISDKTITLSYKKPDGTTYNKTVTTGSDGSFSDSYKPDTTGSWSIIASWLGDSNHYGSSSSMSNFAVKPKSFIETPLGMATVGAGIIIAVIAAMVLVLRKRRS
jgi:hypothetical protein